MKSNLTLARLIAAACLTFAAMMPAVSLANDENVQKALDVLNAVAGRTQNSGTPPAAAPAAAVPTASTTANLSGEYVYLGRGIAMVSQTGDQVRILATWTPVAGGPHYEMKGKLVGDTLVGEWYSYYAHKGWFRLIGRVHPDGAIDLAGSDDPIRANIGKAVLTRKR